MAKMRNVVVLVLVLVLVLALVLCVPSLASVAQASCYDRLDQLGVSYRRGKAKKGVKMPVALSGPLSGITYHSYKKRDLYLDCSLVYSLAIAGSWLGQLGITHVRYSSAYQRRRVRGTHRLSKHSFGLAIDMHAFRARGGKSLTVKDDYEQGLGDNRDCVGRPLTRAGAVVRLLFCQFDRSELFRIVLTPDYDQDHFNHFHVEALPWNKRQDARRPLPAALVGRVRLAGRQRRASEEK